MSVCLKGKKWTIKWSKSVLREWVSRLMNERALWGLNPSLARLIIIIHTHGGTMTNCSNSMHPWSLIPSRQQEPYWFRFANREEEKFAWSCAWGLRGRKEKERIWIIWDKIKQDFVSHLGSSAGSKEALRWKDEIHDPVEQATEVLEWERKRFESAVSFVGEKKREVRQHDCFAQGHVK